MFFLPAHTIALRQTPQKNSGVTNGQVSHGIFTKAEIAPGTIIGDYIGKILHPKEVDEEKDGLYEMYYHDYASIIAAPDTLGVHRINHSCEPNCWLYTYRGHTLFFALRRIFPEEELTVSYLLGLQKDCNHDCDHFCHCGALTCRKTMHTPKEMHERWWKFEEKTAKQTRKERICYGKNLKILDDYPKNIPDHSVYDLFGNAKIQPVSRDDVKQLSKNHMRELIRESGRTIQLEKLDKRIMGVAGETIISD